MKTLAKLESIAKELFDGDVELNAEDVSYIIEANYIGDIEEAIKNKEITFKVTDSVMDIEKAIVIANGIIECNFKDSKMAEEFPAETEAHLIVDTEGKKVMIIGGGREQTNRQIYKGEHHNE